MKRSIVLMVLLSAIIGGAVFLDGFKTVEAEQALLKSAEPIVRAQYPSKPGELIVKFNDAVEAGRVDEINEQFGARIVKRFRITGAYHIELQDKARTWEIIRAYNELPETEYAEPNYIYEAFVIPNDPYYSQLWGMEKIQAPEAWDIQTGDSSIVVAVIDTGLDYNHEDIIGNVWQNAGEMPDNGYDDDGNGYVDDVRGWNFVSNNNNPDDDNNHGTHCSGVIGAVGDNYTGVVGVNWNVKVMPLKFLNGGGSGDLDDAVSAIEYAIINGADVMSNSWGGGGYSQTMYDAISAADDEGIIFVAAAGNSYTNTDNNPAYPACYDLDNIISVAATTSSDGKAYFSNYGLVTVDLGAPGSGIYSTVAGNGYSSMDGTSMACPHVAGACAMVWAEFPDFTHAEVKDRILTYVDLISSMAGKCVTGGRLNLYRALIGGAPNPTPTPAPTPGPGFCAVADIAGNTWLENDLNKLRIIRDEQISMSDRGQEWIYQYEIHSQEIAELVNDNPDYYRKALVLLSAAVNQAPRAIKGEPIDVPAKVKRNAEKLMDQISTKASPGLKHFLQDCEDILQKADGSTVEELFTD